VKELPDGVVIEGVKGFHGNRVESFGDHRTAMSLAIASLAAQGEVVIEGVGPVATSYPDFFKDFSALRTS
jgi:3-phosphoshikimate 1-carboxyvinyltransferase